MDASKLIEPTYARPQPVTPVVPVVPAGNIATSASVETPIAPPEPQEQGTISDMMHGIVHGIEGAVIGAREDVRAVGRAVLPTALQGEALQGPLKYSTTAPTGTMGKLTDDLTRFGLGFMAGGAIVKGAKVAGLAAKAGLTLAEGGYALNAAKSALGTAIVADPHAARLSNILQDHPYLQNPVTEYLAAKPTDTFAEGKFKAALEDTLTSGVATLAFKTFAGAKSALFPGKAAVVPFVPEVGPLPRLQSDAHLLSQHLGIDTDTLIGGYHAHPTLGASVPEVLASNRAVIDTQVNGVFKAAQKALLTGEGKTEAFGALTTLRESLTHLRGQVLGESATKTDPQALVKFIAHAGGEDHALARLTALGDNPSAMAKFARGLDSIPEVPTALAKVLDKTNAYWYSSVLSGVSTHIINPVSTATNLLVQPLNLVVGGTMRREWGDVRDGLALYKGLSNHLFESFAAAKQMWKGDVPGLGGHYSVDEIASEALKATTTPAGMWGRLLQVPGKMLRTEDEFFKQIAYRSHVKVQITREGMDLVKAGTMNIKELDGYIANRFLGAFDAEGRGLQKSAMDYAARATFNQDLQMATWMGSKSISEGVEEFASGQPFLRSFILPFVRVPVNIMRQVIDYTPILGQVKAQFKKDILAGGVLKTEALGRLGLGSAMWAGAGMLAYDGKITGRAAVDPQVAAQQRLNGWQPYSIVLTAEDGTKTYISYRRFDPFGSVLGLAADLSQASTDLPENEQNKLASLASISMMNNLVSKTYLKGLVDTLDALASNDPHKIERWIGQRIASFVPAALGSLQPDIEHKEFRGILDQAMSKIPGFSETIESKRDIFGAKIVPTVGYPTSAFNPFTVSQTGNSVVREELSRLAHSAAETQFHNPDHTKGNVDLTAYKNANGQSAYDRWIELSGQGLEAALERAMSTSRYKTGSDGNSLYKEGSRVLIIRELINMYRHRGFNAMQREFPDVRQAIRIDVQQKRDVRRGTEAEIPDSSFLNFKG